MSCCTVPTREGRKNQRRTAQTIAYSNISATDNSFLRTQRNCNWNRPPFGEFTAEQFLVLCGAGATKRGGSPTVLTAVLTAVPQR